MKKSMKKKLSLNKELKSKSEVVNKILKKIEKVI